MDFIENGQGHGDVAVALLNAGMDARILRPFVGNDGRSYVTVTDNGKEVAKPLTNATATLRKDDWILLDKAIVKAAKPRLKAVADLLSGGLRFNIPNGMAKTVLQTSTQSDISEADISMDGLRDSTADRPVFELTNLPLPIIHKDFFFPTRQVMVSRNDGSPLDTTTAEPAGRRVAEIAEQLLIGTYGTYKYGGGYIYGYTNYPNTMTKTITSPEAGGWTPAATVSEILAMILQSQQAFHYGPFMAYFSLPWTVYLEDDYSTAKGDNTLRERVKTIENISDVRILDYLSLTDYEILLVQMSTDVVREIMGMEITTVQWESHGGFQLNFKVLAIMVPQLRADQNDNTGIVYGTT